MNKWGINLVSINFEKVMKKMSDEVGEEKLYDSIASLINIDKAFTVEEISRALVHFCFRNGPIEDIHAKGKVSQEDMKTLNKFCHNKIYTFLQLLLSGKKGEVYQILDHYSKFGKNWDMPELDMTGIIK